MITNNIFFLTNTIFCDPLGQFEISNMFSTSCVHGYTIPESTTLFAWLLTFLTKTFSLIFGAQMTVIFDTISDFGSFFNGYINWQIHYFYYNLFIGAKLFPLFILEPNAFFLNFIQDAYYKIIADAYMIPSFKTQGLLHPTLLHDFLSFFNFNIFDAASTYNFTPLHYTLASPITFQDFFFNYFVQDLYLTQVLFLGQRQAFLSLNIFGLLLNQQTVQGVSLTNLNALLSAQNATLLYKSLDFTDGDVSMLDGNNSLSFISTLKSFDTFFGIGIPEIAALFLNSSADANNANNNNSSINISEQELAFLLGVKLYLIFCTDIFAGLERLWNNFGSIHNLIKPSIFSAERCFFTAKPFDPFTSDFIYHLGADSRNYFLTLRLLTTYHTLFWPQAAITNKEEIIKCSEAILWSFELNKKHDISLYSVHKALSTKDSFKMVSKMYDIAQQLSLTPVLEYAKIVYNIDKLLAIQKHSYNDVAILNLERLPAELNFISSSKYKYNFSLWCFFQFKQHGKSFFENYVKGTECTTGSCSIKVSGYDESYKNMISGVKFIGLHPLAGHAANIADMVCVDVIDSGEFAELDFSQSALLKELLKTDTRIKYILDTALSLCLKTLASFYVSADSPTAAEYYTDILFNFMSYIVRGVILNKNPELFFSLPSSANIEYSSSYEPMSIFLKQGVVDDIFRPLLHAFNTEYFGHTEFVKVSDLITFLLLDRNSMTFNEFIEKFGMTIFSEFLICVKNLWFFAASGTEFKLDSAFKPIDSFDEVLTPKLEASLNSILQRYLNLDIPSADRHIIGPYSYFAIILQQYPYIGLSFEHFGLIKLKHDFDISRYELFFNYYAKSNPNTAKLLNYIAHAFIETYTPIIDGSISNIAAAHKAFDFNLFKFYNEFFYLSDSTGNLLFFKRWHSVCTEYFVSIFFGLLINNQSVIIAYIVLIFSILFFTLPFLNNIKLIPLNWQYTMENIYKFILNILNAQVGKTAAQFFPYVFSMFCIILVANIAGMTLFAFTLTSHILVTFTLGVSSFLGLTILGFFVQKLAFFNLFLPKGIPTALIPILLVVEVISYVSRALSLSIRLFANLMSGHTLLHILAFFSSKLFKFKYFVGLLSFVLILAIVVLEFCIAILQAYVFAILICIYLNDSFHGGH